MAAAFVKFVKLLTKKVGVRITFGSLLLAAALAGRLAESRLVHERLIDLERSSACERANLHMQYRAEREQLSDRYALRKAEGEKQWSSVKAELLKIQAEADKGGLPPHTNTPSVRSAAARGNDSARIDFKLRLELLDLRRETTHRTLISVNDRSYAVADSGKL